MNGEPQILARWIDPTIDDLKTALDEANKQITILGNMIDKAIEYIMTNLISEWDIENDGCVSGSDLPVDAITPILDILKGSD